MLQLGPQSMVFTGVWKGEGAFSGHSPWKFFTMSQRKMTQSESVAGISGLFFSTGKGFSPSELAVCLSWSNSWEQKH